jgi:hypothetical protein
MPGVILPSGYSNGKPSGLVVLLGLCIQSVPDYRKLEIHMDGKR